MTEEETGKEFYKALRERFSHSTDPYSELQSFALNDFIGKYINQQTESLRKENEALKLDVEIQKKKAELNYNEIQSLQLQLEEKKDELTQGRSPTPKQPKTVRT